MAPRRKPLSNQSIWATHRRRSHILRNTIRKLFSINRFRFNSNINFSPRSCLQKHLYTLLIVIFAFLLTNNCLLFSNPLLLLTISFALLAIDKTMIYEFLAFNCLREKWFSYVTMLVMRHFRLIIISLHYRACEDRFASSCQFYVT